jgi:hypothetical protein
MLCHAIFHWRFKWDVLDLAFFAAAHGCSHEVGYWRFNAWISIFFFFADMIEMLPCKNVML